MLMYVFEIKDKKTLLDIKNNYKTNINSYI